MGRCSRQRSWTLLLLVQLIGVVVLPLWLWPWTISAVNLNQEHVVLGESSVSLDETETRESFLVMDKSPEEDEKVEEVNGSIFESSSDSYFPTAMALLSPPECHPVYAFDTVGPYRQEEAKTRAKERIYYYRETDTNEEEDSILTKDEFGLVCFSKMINCTVPPTATTATSRKTPNCVYFEKEFCTRKYGQMKWKGSVCPTILLAPQDYKCTLRALGGSGGVEVAGSVNGKNKTLNCKNSEALCLALKPPFHTRSGSSDRNPPTQSMCLCPLGYTGPACSRMDIDLFHLDLLHNIDLRNILLKYQQKDRYFIGVTLLFLLVVTLSSVLLVVAGCSFLFFRLPNFIHSTKSFTTEIRYISRSGSGSKRRSDRDHHRDEEVEENDKGESAPVNVSANRRARRRISLGRTMIITATHVTRRMVTAWQYCLNRFRVHEDEEEYYDSDLELRFHRARMERTQRLSQRGRVSV